MFYLDFDGPVAKRIDKQTYNDLKEITSKIKFSMPVETDVKPGQAIKDLENPKIVVQLLRITDEYLKALEQNAFDISRILSPERLEFYRINKNK